MPEVDSLHIKATASVNSAVGAINEAADAMDNLGDATNRTANATDKAADKFKGTAAEIRKLAASATGAGLTNLGKQMKDISKSVSANQDLDKMRKQAEGVADALEKKGDFLNADKIRGYFEEPKQAEQELIDAIQREKDERAKTAEAAKVFAEGEKLMAKMAADAKREAERKKREDAAETYRNANLLIKQQAADEKAAAMEASLAEKERHNKEMEAIASERLAYKQKADEERKAAAIQKAEAKAAAAEEAAAAKAAAAEAKAAAKEKADAEKAAQKKAAAAAKEATKRLNDSSKAARGFGASLASPLSGIKKLTDSIKRIAFYRIIRSGIKAVTQATKEGLTNLKEYSAAFGTAFSPAVDNLRQHVLLLKNAFATALRPILEALIPIVIRLCNWLVKLADFLAQVFSVLTGKVDANGRYTKAVLGDLQQSNKEAKALRRTLLGFDEINRLDGDSPSGQSTTSPGTMFEQAEVSEEAKKWAERLKKVLDIVKKIIGAVVQFIKDNPWILKLAAYLLAAYEAGKLLKKVFQGILSVAKFLLNPVVLLVTYLISAALYGDKIYKWIMNAKKKVDEFFDGLKQKYPKLSGAIETVQKIVDFLMESVALLSDAIYKFAHGDVEGAMEDINELLEKTHGFFDGLKGDSEFLNTLLEALGHLFSFVFETIGLLGSAIVKFVNGDVSGALDDLKQLGINVVAFFIQIGIDVLNFFLGIFADAVNALAKAWTWLHNKVWAPAINWIVTRLENGRRKMHNFVIDVELIIVKGWKVIWGFLKEKFGDVINSINDLIKWMNKTFGTNINPIEFNTDTTNLDKKIAELEAKKLDPLTETVEVIGQWREPEKLRLHIDTTGAELATQLLGQKVQSVLYKIQQMTTTWTSASGHLKKEHIIEYASGGFPAVGSVFVAGEAGPEIVGSFNGRTGVMNTEQMATAMYQAVSAALQANPQGGGDIFLDGEVIYRNTVRRNNNRVRATGRSALLT